VKLRLLLKIDTAIQEPEPGTGTVHNLCKLEHFAPQGIYMIIIYRGGTQLKDITISVTSEAF
jgi:hypothetical protein